MLLAIGTIAVAFLSSLMLIWLDDRIADQIKPRAGDKPPEPQHYVSLARRQR